MSVTKKSIWTQPVIVELFYFHQSEVFNQGSDIYSLTKNIQFPVCHIQSSKSMYIWRKATAETSKEGETSGAAIPTTGRLRTWGVRKCAENTACKLFHFFRLPIHGIEYYGLWILFSVYFKVLGTNVFNSYFCNTDCLNHLNLFWIFTYSIKFSHFVSLQ